MLDDVPGEVMEAVRQGIPRGRLAEIDDNVPTLVFLASDASRHVQGQCISPNGGSVSLVPGTAHAEPAVVAPGSGPTQSGFRAVGKGCHQGIMV